MKLKSSRSLVLAAILISVAGIITTLDYLEGLRSTTPGPNDYFEISNYQGSVHPTQAEQWLSMSTSSSSNPESGLIYIDLFDRGKTSNSVKIANKYLENAPNLVFAILASNSWQSGQEITQDEMKNRLNKADWHLAIKWKSPLEVFTQDKKGIKPETVYFWPEGDGLILALEGWVLTVNDNYAQELFSQVKTGLASVKKQIYEDGQVVFRYPEKCQVDKQYISKNKVYRYELTCAQGKDAGMTLHLVPHEFLADYDLGGLVVKQEVKQESTDGQATSSTKVSSRQSSTLNGLKTETYLESIGGETYIIAISADADLLGGVVGSIELK